MTLPRDNTDLWAYFMQCLQGCDIEECRVRWDHCCLPSFMGVSGKRLTKRQVDFLCRGGLSVSWESRLASVSSVSIFGAKFRCAGIGGFVPVLKSALCDLSLQLHSARSLRDLRIPFVN